MTSTVTSVAPLAAPLKGTCTVSGDKSISHRAVLFAAMSEGVSHLTGVLDSDDVRASLKAVEQLGAQVITCQPEEGGLSCEIKGWGADGPIQPDSPIDCGNSGTTARLLMGVLAPWDISVTLTGDASLCTRPMKRITAPLMKMGARFDPAGAEHLPVTETGTPNLKALTYDTPMASAQLKSAILLAGIYAQGTTTVREPASSRNHTELMLGDFGVKTTSGNLIASVKGPACMKACDVTVPGDPSSAAFLICAAALKPGSSVRVDNLTLNEARIGFVRTLERMGADIEARHCGHIGKEPCGYISLRYKQGLRGCEIPASKIAGLVDEVPILALVAAHARGITIFRDVSELRAKESNRLQAIIDGLEVFGIDAWEDGDDLCIQGDPDFEIPADCTMETLSDHRLAMTWAVAALTGNRPIGIADFESVGVSFPDFMPTVEKLTA